MIDRSIAPHYTNLTKVNIPQSKTRLSSNGIKFHYLKGNSDFTQIDVHFFAGSAFQKQFLVASFTNGLLREGTKYHSSSEIAEKLDYYGAWLKCGSSIEKASLSLFSLQKFLPETLQILDEIMKFPVFPENEFLTIKNQAKQKFLLRNEKVVEIAEKEFLKKIYGPCSKFSATAELEDYEGIQIDWINDFYNSHYTMAPSDVYITGNLSDNEKKRVESIFESYPSLTTLPQVSHIYKFDPQPECELFIKKENSVQAAINMGQLLFSRTHPDFHKFSLLNTVLGGYFGSRLMSNIREDKGYTYGIYSTICSNLDTGHFQINTQTANEYIRPVLNEINLEIKRLCSELIPDKELAIVKNYMIGSLARMLDGDFSRTSLYISLNNNGLDMQEYIDNRLDVINNTTAEELRLLAQKYWGKGIFHQVIVGENKSE